MNFRFITIVLAMTTLAACTPGEKVTSNSTAPSVGPSGFPEKYASTPEERRALYRGSRAGVSSR